MFSVIKNNRNGFTLLELLVAAAIMSVMLLAVFSLLSFGVNTFEAGKQRIDLQQNVRIAADFIFRETRYANELEIVSPTEISFALPENNNQYVIKQKGAEIVLLTNFAENKIAYQIKELEFSFCDNNHILDIFIDGDDGEHSFTLRTSLQIRNL